MSNKNLFKSLWLLMLFLVVGTVSAQVTTQEALSEAISKASAGSTVEISAAGTYTVPGISNNITVKGTVDGVVFDCVGSGSIASIPNGCTFENVAFNMGTNDYHGFQHAGTINMNGCTINGKFFSYGDMNFNGCIFNQTASDYSMWDYGKDLTYTNCTFNCNGKFINVFNEGNGNWKLKVEGCTFNSTKKNKAALNIKASCVNGNVLGWDVTINNCKVNDEAMFPSASGDATSALYVGSPIWQVDDRTAAALEANIVKVAVDGVFVYGADLTISNKEELIAFEQAVNAGSTYAGKLVVLESDIDLAGIAWKPIGNVTSYPGITFSGTFDGQNHTISNMTTSDNLANHATAGFFGSSNGTIKNLTLKDIKVTSSHWAAGICGYTSDKALKIENCKVIGGTITSVPELLSGSYDNGDKVGGILGYGVAAATISGCAVEGLTITAYRDLGGIAGCMSGLVSDCSVKNTTIVQSNKNGYKTGVTTYKEIVGRDANANNTGNTSENVELKSISGEDPVTVDVPTATEEVEQVVKIEKAEDAPEATTEEVAAATTAVTTVLEEISNNTTVTSDEATNVAEVESVTTLKIEVKNVAVETKTENAQTTATVTKVTYDVQPMNNEEKVSTTTKAIEFRLPVPQSFKGTSVKVSHKHGEATTSTIEAVQGKGANKYVALSSDKFSEWTLEDLNANTVAVIDETGAQFETLLGALNAVNSQTIDNVTIVVLKDVAENIGSTKYSFTKNLTITASAPRKIDFQNTEATGYLQPTDGTTLTIAKNITIDGLGNFGPDDNTGTAIINGTVKAIYFRARGGNNKTGTGNLIVNGLATANTLGTGECYLRFKYDGYVEFNNVNTIENTNMYVNGEGKGKVVFNNSTVKMLKIAPDTNKPNTFSFELNNSIVSFSGADFSDAIITGSLKMDDKSTFDVGAGFAKLTIAAGATAELVPGAKIIANGLQNNGTIKIDLTGASGKTLLIDYNGNKTLAAANYGHIVNENNEDFTTYVENNDLYANLASKIAAFIDLNGYETLAAAIAAVPTDGTATTIKVNKDIDLAAALTVANTKNITLDLNGKTVKNEASKSLAQLITVNGKLTIDDSSADKNGKIQNTASNTYVVKTGIAAAVLTLNNGTIETTTGNSNGAVYGTNGAFVMTGGKIIAAGTGVGVKNVNISGGVIAATAGPAISAGGTISGGTITSTGKYSVYASSGDVLNITGGTFAGKAGEPTIRINNTDVKVSEGVVLPNGIDFVSNAKAMLLAGTSASSIANTDIAIYDGETVLGYATVKSDIFKSTKVADKTVKLTKNIATTTYIGASQKFTLDLNGYNIVCTPTKSDAAFAIAGTSISSLANVTIKGEGKISCADHGEGCNAIQVAKFATLNIEGGEFSVPGDNTTIYALATTQSFVTTINISGGKFESGDGKYVLNIKDDVRTYNTFNVTGGTFVGFNPANCISEGNPTNFVAKAFEAVDNADGTWTVKLAPVYIDVHENVSVSYTGTPNDDETSAANEVVSALASNTAVTETGSTNVTDITAVTNLAITVKEVAVETTPAVDETPATATVTKVTYDVQPMNGEDMVTVTERPITFRLPVPQSFKGTYVKVSHLHEDVTTSTIESVQVANANKYVTLSSNKFSEWTLEDVNPSTVAVIGETQYNSLADAVAAATEGQTITMLADADVTAQVEVAGKNITLDLNGKKIEYTGTTTLNSGVILVHNGAGLTINGEAEGSAIVSGEKAYAAVAVTKKNDDATQPAVLTVNSGTLTGYYYAVVGNGTRHNTEITINGGNLTGQGGTAIYHPQDGTLNIAGGNLTGAETAVELRAGTINVTGGTLTSTATDFEQQGNGSGTTIVGAALAVSQHTTNKDIAVNISGGEFNGIKAVYERDYQDTNCDNIAMDITGGTFNGSVASQNVEKFVSGGSFSVAPALEYCEEGYAPGFQNDGTFTVKEYAVAVLDQNGNVKGAYKKITAPTNAELGQPHTDLSLFNDDKKTIKVVENDVIVLLKDISANVQWGTISNNVKFSIDLNGHTWTGTSSLYYDGSTINVKNGKIAGGVQVKSMTFNVEESTEITGDIKLDSQAQSTNINVAGKIAGITDEGTKSNSSRTITFAETANVNGQLALNKEQQDTRKITYNVNITCGTFNTNGHTILLSEKNINNVTISGGTFVTGGNGPLNIAAKVITGGTFDTDVNANCVAGYEAVDNGNGTWTVKYVGARVLKVYKTDGTYEELSKSLFEEYQETNPNAMAIVSSENADEVEGMTNVIVDYPVGKNGRHYYECEKFVLTDKENWYSPVDFTAISGSYTRTNVGGLNSVCMPFELNSSNIPANSSIKLFSYTNDSQTDVFFRTYPQASAGQACILDCPSDIETWVVEFDETEISASTISSALVGAYQKRTIGEGYYKVNADGDKFTKTTSSSTVTPFRCYLDLSQDGVLPANAPALRIVFEDDGVEGITDVETATEDNAKIYGVDGILRGTIRPGLNIIQSNGVSKKIYK